MNEFFDIMTCDCDCELELVIEQQLLYWHTGIVIVITKKYLFYIILIIINYYLFKKTQCICQKGNYIQ